MPWLLVLLWKGMEMLMGVLYQPASSHIHLGSLSSKWFAPNSVSILFHGIFAISLGLKSGWPTIDMSSWKLSFDFCALWLQYQLPSKYEFSLGYRPKSILASTFGSPWSAISSRVRFSSGSCVGPTSEGYLCHRPNMFWGVWKKLDTRDWKDEVCEGLSNWLADGGATGAWQLSVEFVTLNEGGSDGSAAGGTTVVIEWHNEFSTPPKIGHHR